MVILLTPPPVGQAFFILFYFIFKVFFFYWFQRESKGGRKSGEKHQCERETSVASCTPPTGHWTLNPGMCPDRESESNWMQDLVVCRTTSHQLSHTGSGWTDFLISLVLPGIKEIDNPWVLFGKHIICCESELVLSTKIC